jgi:hypothetical protein
MILYAFITSTIPGFTGTYIHRPYQDTQSLKRQIVVQLFHLSYTLHENAFGDDIVPDDHDSIDTYKEAIVPFSGPSSEIDNNLVFDSLKSYVLGGPHWTWIQNFEKKRDGIVAWLALQAHFDGPSNHIHLKASAHASIRRAKYKGSKKF